MLLSLAYRLLRCLFSLLAVVVRSDLSTDIELLVLRHENQALRRQLGGRLVVETVLLQRLYVLVFIEHGTRGLHLAGVTARPAGAWAAQRPQPRDGPG